MSKAQEALSDSTRTWSMPLSTHVYDQQSTLTNAERKALAEVATLRSFLPCDHPVVSLLARLTQPLQEVYELKQVKSVRATKWGLTAYLRFMYQQMTQRGKAFWGWSQEEWATAHLSAHAIGHPHGELITLRIAAYLFGGYLVVDDGFSPTRLASLIFGKELVMAQYERVARVMFGQDGLGYHRSGGQEGTLVEAITLAMLVNRNPYIEAITIESLQVTRQFAHRKWIVKALARFTRALVYLKIVKVDLSEDATSPLPWAYNKPDVNPHWVAWLQAYMMQTHGLSAAHRTRTFYYLLIAGRWLNKYHPTITTPEQWDEALAYEYATWVCAARRGELVSRDMYMPSFPPDAPIPLQASSIEGRLCAVRQFFKALQKRPYQVENQPARRLPFLWDPNEVFATPAAIRKQLLPNPRNLDQAWWQKLTWAAASLSAKDLSGARSGIYPLAYYRAAGLLWVPGARRSDEIRRLKVGCVSREWVPEMRDEAGNQLEPEEHLAYLRVPVNKMQVMRDYFKVVNLQSIVSQ